MIPKVSDLRTAAAKVVRRGSRTILLTEEWPKFGNFMYFWLHAYACQQAGRNYRILTNRSTEAWLNGLPEVRKHLTVTRQEIRLWDRREWPPAPEYFQRFGSSFDSTTLDSFIREMVLGSPLMAPALLPDLGDEMVVNIRRGDYYSNPGHRENFGFDIEPYLRESLRRASGREAISGLKVVSDDIVWCQQNVDHVLHEYSEAVSYARRDSTPQDDFRSICCARTLICANSTFSYWGGYVSTVLHGGASHVIAPDFHSRNINEGAAYQLDDRWDVVAVPR